MLTPLESITVNCTAVGRSDAYNLTLWKNNRLLAYNYGNSLIYSTQPSQYGTYRCAVDSVHNTSLLSEKGNVKFVSLCDTLTVHTLTKCPYYIIIYIIIIVSIL